jgi:hypothetical protein
VHPLAAIAANTTAANTALTNLLFMVSPGPEQFLTRKTTRVNPIPRQYARQFCARVKRAFSPALSASALTASDTQA